MRPLCVATSGSITSARSALTAAIVAASSASIRRE